MTILMEPAHSLTIYTIGFTKKTAEEFFTLLERHSIRRLLDVRRNNSSQLAGFTKEADLRFFLQRIGQIEYVHELLFAPPDSLLKQYRKKKISWDEYEQQFIEQLEQSKSDIFNRYSHRYFATPTVLLCSEETADRCHRRLVAEFLKKHWESENVLVEIEHL